MADDPFERAAQRARSGALSRREGPVSRVLDEIAPALGREARRLATLPPRMVEAAYKEPESLAGLGGELAGSAVETMFGPKGSSKALRAGIIGNISATGEALGGKLIKLLPNEWTISEVASKPGTFKIIDPTGLSVGTAAFAPESISKAGYHYKFTTNDGTQQYVKAILGSGSTIQKKAAEASAKMLEAEKSPFANLDKIMKAEAAKSGGLKEPITPEEVFANLKALAEGKPPPFKGTPEDDSFAKALKRSMEQLNKDMSIPTGSRLITPAKSLADLPPMLPPAELEAARVAGGYTTPAYRGRAGITEGRRVPSPNDSEIYASPNPQLAELYAGTGTTGQQIQPLYLNTRDYLTHDARGANWAVAQRDIYPKAQRERAPGVIIHNVWDEPAGGSAAHSALGAPQTTYTVFDPRTRKSMFARQFDPTSPDILKARVTGRSPAALTPEQEESAHTEKLKSSIDRFLSMGEPNAP